MNEDNTEFIRKRYQPKGGMCALCMKRNTDCSELDFSKMTPVLDDYIDQTGLNPFHVIIVKCKEYKRT